MFISILFHPAFLWIYLLPQFLLLYKFWGPYLLLFSSGIGLVDGSWYFLRLNFPWVFKLVSFQSCLYVLKRMTYFWCFHVSDVVFVLLSYPFFNWRWKFDSALAIEYLPFGFRKGNNQLVRLSNLFLISFLFFCSNNL